MNLMVSIKLMFNPIPKMIAFSIVLLTAIQLHAQEAIEKANLPQPQETVVEFRINKKTLTMLVERNVHLTLPINQTTGKASVTGSATVNATVALDFDRATDTRVPIRIVGQSDVFATAHAGPVIANINGRIPFTLDLAFGFDERNGFYALPSYATANTCISIECIDTDRRRLGRRLIRRVANRVAHKKLPEAQSAANREVMQKLASEADNKLQKMVREINATFKEKINDTLIAMSMDKGFDRRQISKRDSFLQLRVATPGTSLVPPKQNVADVPIEVWIYPPIDNDKLTEQISDFWDEVPDELMNLIPQDLDTGEQNPKEVVKMTVEGGWTVLRIGDFQLIEELLKKSKTSPEVSEVVWPPR